MDKAIRLTADVSDEGRFHRQELIEWWDQGRLSRARVLVIGAGALGNEIIKNLALVGAGAVFVADMDRIELSNLARSVLFREEDIGRNKAEAASERAKSICPEMRVQPFVGNIVHDLGAGVFHWADIVICGLDNREARVAVNRICLKMGRPWIDGAIEGLGGVARIFLPDSGACYECTMNETDWQMLEARRSCALLGRREMEAGRTPTTATSSSIVAGFQCQEMLKYLHGLAVEGGTGLVINGQMNDVYAVSYQRKDDCWAHETLDEVVELQYDSRGVTISEILDRARDDLGQDATLELSREILHELECMNCGERETVLLSLGKVTEDDALCAQCGKARFPRLVHGVGDGGDWLERTPAEMGLPPFDVFVSRSGQCAVGYLLAGDAESVLGEVAPSANEKQAAPAVDNGAGDSAQESGQGG